MVDVTQIAMLAAIWGFTFLFIKVSVAGLTPLWLVATRTASGFMVLVLALAVLRVPLPRGAITWLHLGFLALPANVIPWTMVAWAQQGVTSAMTAVLYSLIPLMTLLMSVLISIERFTLRKMIGLVLASVGTTVVVGLGLDTTNTLPAVFTVLAACALLAAGAVYAKRFVTPHVAALPMATAQIGIAFIISGPLALLIDGVPEWSALTPAVISAALTLGTVGTGVAFLLYYILIERVGATNATMVTYLTPVIGVIAGGVFLNEPIPLTLVAGGLVIIIGIWVAQSSAQSSPRIGGPV